MDSKMRVNKGDIVEIMGRPVGSNRYGRVTKIMDSGKVFIRLDGSGRTIACNPENVRKID